MAEEAEGWRGDLRRDLTKVAEHYTPERYPQTVETQRDYEQKLNTLQDRYTEKLDYFFRGERSGYDRSYRENLQGQLAAREQEAQSHARMAKDQLALREGLRGDRAAIERGEYRESQPYKDGMQNLVHSQADAQGQMSRAFEQVERGLNERFGFCERDQDRENERPR
ncbi:MAG TPA: hypothetical protein VGL56_20960 [Fimbriimonadaceae bacterium]|jgi:hypothetical protein